MGVADLRFDFILFCCIYVRGIGGFAFCCLRNIGVRVMCVVCNYFMWEGFLLYKVWGPWGR